MLLVELQECFASYPSSELDLSQLRITLDLVFLTLPAESELSEDSARPCYTRFTSVHSTGDDSQGEEEDGGSMGCPTIHTDFG